MARRTTVQRGSGPMGNTASYNKGAQQRGPRTDDTEALDPEGILEEALRRANEAWTAERNNVAEGRDCQRFYAGGSAQWDSKAWNERTRKNRPTLTVNRLPQFVKQLTGDIRKNPPALKFLPAKGDATEEIAEAFNGIAKHIEQQSQAKDVYVQAVENAAQASQGFFRVTTEYSDDDSFDLDIRIRPIRDPFGALIDPYATLFDKSDMRYAYVFEHIAIEEFKKEYPDAPVVDVPGGGDTAKVFPWRVGNTVRIAEYWRKVPGVKKRLYLLPDGSVVDDLSTLPEEAQAALKEGLKMGEVRTRDVETTKVEMYRMCGSAILDGPHAWPGKYIPVCMVVGEEINLDGSTVRKGMVHDARDPQRIYNYSRSASVEAVALQPKAPFIGTVDQFKNRPEWQTAGSENHAYLAYNPDPRAPGAPQRSQPALASQGLDAQAAIADQDMKAVTGIYDASLGNRSNETAGVAIQARQREGDTATFLYVDNLTRAIGYLGKILADLIPRVYDTARQVRILRADGTAEMLPVNQHLAMQRVDEMGQPVEMPEQDDKPIYDLSAGEYDVVVTTGPTFATQRAEAQANIVETMRAWPKVMEIAPDIVFKAMDWPGADELAERATKFLPPGITEDGPPPPPPPPPPNVIADVEKTNAETAKIKAEAEGKQLENAQVVMQMQMMGVQMQQMAQAVAGLQAMLAGSAPMMPGAPPASPGGPPLPVPPPAPGMPPMMEAPADDGLPPMVEVNDMPPGVGPV